MTENINCKYCCSNNVIKYGTQSDTQMYYCKDCQRKFKADDSLFGGRVPASDVSNALLQYYSGLSINDIRRSILQEKGYEPSASTIYQWIEKYTDKAVKYYGQFQPKVGDVWVADEIVIHLDGKKDVWMWDIIDQDTRFLLATKLSYTRNIEDAVTLFELAKQVAGKSPKVILTDGLGVYPEAVERVFGSDSAHKQSSPFVQVDSTSNIERWHETLRERVKVLYGLRNANSALGFIDGFVVYYNFIRPHDGLDGKTPAQEAGIIYQAKNWADVTRLDDDDNLYRPQVIIPPKLEMARREIKGKPYKPGKKRKSKPIIQSETQVPIMFVSTSKRKVK